MGGRGPDDARRPALVFASCHSDGANVARGVSPGLPASRGAARLGRWPARPQLACAAPHNVEPACGDAGRAEAGERRCRGWQRAHAPAGGQHGPQAVRQGRVAARDARDGDTPAAADPAFGRGRRHRPDRGLHADHQGRGRTHLKPAPCSIKSQGLWRRSPATVPIDQDRVYASVAERHPETAVVVPPRSTAVPSDTAETAPTQRDGHPQRVADRPGLLFLETGEAGQTAGMAALSNGHSGLAVRDQDDPVPRGAQNSLVGGAHVGEPEGRRGGDRIRPQRPLGEPRRQFPQHRAGRDRR